VDAAAAQALGQFIGDGIALLALGGVLIQLDLQRRELAAQRRQSAAADEERRKEDAQRRKREELLEVQLAEALRERDASRRQQANRVDVSATTTTVTPSGITLAKGDSLHAVEVTNDSDRPIRNVRGGIRLGDAQYMDASVRYLRVKVGPPDDPAWMGADHKSEEHRVPTIRAGQRWVFAFPYSSQTHPHAVLAVRFVDDTGLEWQVDADMHLSPIKPDEWMY
jgi:hypothetical protein